MPNHDINPPLLTPADFRRLEQKIDRLLELFESKAGKQKADFDAMAEKAWNKYKNRKPKRK